MTACEVGVKPVNGAGRHSEARKEPSSCELAVRSVVDDGDDDDAAGEEAESGCRCNHGLLVDKADDDELAEEESLVPPSPDVAIAAAAAAVAVAALLLLLAGLPPETVARRAYINESSGLERDGGDTDVAVPPGLPLPPCE